MVAIVRVEDVKANVNLYLEFGSLFQSIKNALLAVDVPLPISECKTKLYISPFIVYNYKLDITRGHSDNLSC